MTKKTNNGQGRIQRRDWRAYLRATQSRDITGAQLAQEHGARMEVEDSSSLSDWRSFYREHWTDFDDLPVRELTAAHVEAWLRARRDDGLAENTLCRVFSFVASMLEHAVRTGAADVNVARQVDRAVRPKRRPRDVMRTRLSVMTAADLRTVCSAHEGTDFWDRWLLTVLALTGQRIGEVAGLTYGALRRDLRPLIGVEVTSQWHTKSKRRRGTKDGASKRLPVHPELAALLHEVPGRFFNECGRAPKETDPLVPYFDPRQVIGARTPKIWNQRTALNRWKDFQARHLSIPASGPRDLRSFRHTFITRLRAAGASPQSVRALTHPLTLDRRPSDAHEGYAHDHLEWASLCRAMLLLDLTKDGPQQLSLIA